MNIIKAFPVVAKAAAVRVGYCPPLLRAAGEFSDVIYPIGCGNDTGEDPFSMGRLHAENHLALLNDICRQHSGPMEGDVNTMFPRSDDSKFSCRIALKGMGAR